MNFICALKTMNGILMYSTEKERTIMCGDYAMNTGHGTLSDTIVI